MEKARAGPQDTGRARRAPPARSRTGSQPLVGAGRRELLLHAMFGPPLRTARSPASAAAALLPGCARLGTSRADCPFGHYSAGPLQSLTVRACHNEKNPEKSEEKTLAPSGPAGYGYRRLRWPAPNPPRSLPSAPSGPPAPPPPAGPETTGSFRAHVTAYKVEARRRLLASSPAGCSTGTGCQGQNRGRPPPRRSTGPALRRGRRTPTAPPAPRVEITI